MTQNLVSKAEFARLSGVSAASITKAVKSSLVPAMVGKRIDANHEAAAQYLAEKGIKLQQAPPPPRVVTGTEAKRLTKKSESMANINQGQMIHEVPDDIQAFADMSVREVVQRFGTDVAFLDWLKATKAIEDINEKRLKNAATKGSLVSRELVKLGIIDPIDAAHIKLLTDGAKTITRRVTAMHDSGRNLDEIEKFVKNQMTSFIRPVKAKVKRALGNA